MTTVLTTAKELATTYYKTKTCNGKIPGTQVTIRVANGSIWLSDAHTGSRWEYKPLGDICFALTEYAKYGNMQVYAFKFAHGTWHPDNSLPITKTFNHYNELFKFMQDFHSQLVYHLEVRGS